MIGFAVKLIEPFRPSQIHQVKHRVLLVMRIALWPTLHINTEDRVRSGGVLMNACLLVDSVVLTIVHKDYGLVESVDLLFVQYSHINSMLRKNECTD